MAVDLLGKLLALEGFPSQAEHCSRGLGLLLRPAPQQQQEEQEAAPQPGEEEEEEEEPLGDYQDRCARQ